MVGFAAGPDRVSDHELVASDPSVAFSGSLVELVGFSFSSKTAAARWESSPVVARSWPRLSSGIARFSVIKSGSNHHYEARSHGCRQSRPRFDDSLQLGVVSLDRVSVFIVGNARTSVAGFMPRNIL